MAVEEAFPGSSLSIAAAADSTLTLQLRQHGLLRPLSAAELSDGTLRYLLWIAALLSPRPAGLLVLNEPETSLHPDLLAPLGRLITRAAAKTQVVVVSHASALLEVIAQEAAGTGTELSDIELVKDYGETRVAGREPLDEPPWRWPKR
jgi:predicted ATPase